MGDMVTYYLLTEKTVFEPEIQPCKVNVITENVHKEVNIATKEGTVHILTRDRQ